MRTVVKYLLGLSVIAGSLMAGALAVQITDPAGNAEAVSKNIAIVAQTTACHEPEKTQITASAEGVVNGVRRTIPLKIVALSATGTYGISRDWPATGTWVVRIVAKNPDYPYVSGILARIDANSIAWSSLERYHHEPTDQEVTAMLNSHAAPDRASLR
jgi:hypothetical protein